MTAGQAASFLGNGVGKVYFTGPSGVFPPPAYEGIPLGVGIDNTQAARNKVLAFAPSFRRSSYGTAATIFVQMTNAAADNLTVFTVNGVSIITAPVAMTAGNLSASAASITASINATVTVPDWSATVSGDMIAIRCNTVGASFNNLPVVMTFSGASTADYSAVSGGGTDAGEYSTRVWIDTSAGASETSIAGATEITQSVSALPPLQVLTKVVVAAAISYTRTDSTMHIMVSGGSFDTVNCVDIQDGDFICLHGDTGAGAPATAIAGGNINLVSGSRLLTNDYDSLWLFWKNGSFNESTPRGTTVEEARAVDIQTAADPGVENATMPNTGTYVIAPGAVAGAYDTSKSFVEFANSVALVGNVQINLVHSLPGQNLKAGDFGAVYVNSAITTGANSISIIDTDAVINQTIPSAMALSGKWGFNWTFDGTQFRASLMINIGATGWIETAAIGALQVTDAKIAGMDGSKLVAASVDFTELSAGVNAAISGNGVQVTSPILVAAANVGGPATPVGLTVPANMAAVVDFMLYRITTFVGPAHAAGDIGVRCVGANQEQAFAIVTKSAAGRWKATNAGEGGAAETMLLLGQDLEIYTTGVGGGGSDFEVIVYYRLVQL